MEYAEDREDIVKGFARVLKPNGKILIDFEHAHREARALSCGEGIQGKTVGTYREKR